ncbi:hypothetical protein PAXRUDRAFT_422083 [Paxillus rubicundulus Ve08.2h10]|uniref:Uncharacterized protein n=1 Tax=Paxillus rubicundulus Ve08.2h10 TaxID=930991 RepID=A0A0D0E8D7_9AGAM|nr:hypothetical protein PAXRUDRAFT_422083 [Paxillus rubicundulus Ve08.2h10]
MLAACCGHVDSVRQVSGSPTLHPTHSCNCRSCVGVVRHCPTSSFQSVGSSKHVGGH